MNIGFVINDITRGRGSERVAVTVANELSSYHKVRFVSLNQENEEPFFKLSGHIRIMQVPASSARLNKVTKKIKEIKYLRKSITSASFDVLIGVGTYPSILLGILSSMWPGCKTKYLGWEHTNLKAVDSVFWSILRKVAYRRLNGLICLNESDKAEFTGYAPLVNTIANPLAFQSKEIAALHNQVILSVGAFEPEKGFDLLIEAFKSVYEKIPGWSLLLIGEGSMENQLQRQINTNNLADRVKIKAPVNDIKAEYLGASLYVLPSRREAFGMVLVEAMECGLPCISFDCPTGPKHLIVNGKNGILVPAEDVGKLGESIRQLVSDKKRLHELAAEGKLAARGFYPASILKQWETCLNKVISR